MLPDLRQIYNDHSPALFAFVLNLTRCETQTREVLQELFLKLARRPEQWAAVREPRAWLLRLAHHLTIDQYRQRSGHELALERAAAADPAPLFVLGADPDEAAFRQALAAALQEIPLEQRAVAHLKLWEGLTFAEIAQALDIPPNTAASRYRYAIDKLQTLLRPIYEELS